MSIRQIKSPKSITVTPIFSFPLTTELTQTPRTRSLFRPAPSALSSHRLLSTFSTLHQGHQQLISQAFHVHAQLI